MTPLSRRQVLSGLGAVGVASALPMSLAACSSDTAADNRVLFLNWQDYIDPALLTEFRKKTGLSVGYETFESNDQLEERLSAAAVTRRRGRKTTSFDLIVPSSNLFSRLRDGNALQQLDSDLVSEALLDNLSPAMRELPADPGNEYAVPWATGTTGIGYDVTVFPEPPDWDVFLDKTHAGKMSLLREAREAFSAALFSLGEDPNTSDLEVLKTAEQQLAAMMQNAPVDSATYLDKLAGGSLVAAQGFSTDVLQASRRNPNLAFVIPASGGTVWVDLLCIPKDAPNPDGANKLVAYYLDPRVSAANAERNLVATGNDAAREFLPASILDNPAIYPPAEVESTLVSIKNLGETEKDYSAAWDRLVS
ncbi:MAG: ABC transporter substrate-binding protein [Nocardioides sp.]